jgi:hypothetical protein
MNLDDDNNKGVKHHILCRRKIGVKMMHHFDNRAAKAVAKAFLDKRFLGRINGRYYSDTKYLYYGFIPVARWNESGTISIKGVSHNPNTARILRSYTNILLRMLYPIRKPPRLAISPPKPFKKLKGVVWMLFDDPRESIIYDGIDWFEFSDKEDYFIPEF